MRRLFLIVAFAGVATAAQAGDRYGGGGDVEASRAAYGAPQMKPTELLTWKSKAPPAEASRLDAYGRVRPEPLSDWARRAEGQRVEASNLAPQAPVIPQSKYTRSNASAVIPDSKYMRSMPPSANASAAALPTSIYDAPPPRAYAAASRPKGAPIEIKPDALPNQPTLAQQMANEEALAMAEAKAARARALEAKNKGQGVLIDSQDAVSDR